METSGTLSKIRRTKPAKPLEGILRTVLRSAEKRRAEESEKMLLMEKQKSEKLAQNLRTLGISLDDII